MTSIRIPVLISLLALCLNAAWPGPARMVKDVNDKPRGSEPAGTIVMDGVAFFAAGDRAQGRELWRTDGTPGGTRLVHDINPGVFHSYPKNLARVGNAIFFAAEDGIHGEELWRTNGTAAGTALVADIWPGPNGSKPQQLIDAGGVLFFVADNGGTGLQIWRSDGTAPGTRQVSALFTLPYWPGPRDLKYVNGLLYFVCRDLPGEELWKTDGTTSGTRPVRDLSPWQPPSDPRELEPVNGELFFTVRAAWRQLREIWRTDGTASGTVLVTDFPTDPDPNATPLRLKAVGGTLYFLREGLAGGVLWKSDGTASGTVIVRRIIDGYARDCFSEITDVNGTLFFIAARAEALDLWKSDGTASGTLLIQSFFGYDDYFDEGYLISYNNSFYFVASETNWPDVELWKSDGTPAGTGRVKDILAGMFGSKPGGFAVLNGELLFSADDGSGRELWLSDGSGAGTIKVASIGQGLTHSAIMRSPLEYHGNLYFIADVIGGYTGYLWRSDGTAAGTWQVSNALASIMYYALAHLGPLHIADDRLFLMAGDGLYVSDGTPAGTSRISNEPPFLAIAMKGRQDPDTRLYSAKGDRLSKSSRSGIELIEDLHPNHSPYTEMISDFAVIGKPGATSQTLIFTCANEAMSALELWRSDGTVEGTQLVKTIAPGYGSNGVLDARYMTNVNGTAYFVAAEGATGKELWKSDGTASGTMMVRDLEPGSYSKAITELVAFQDNLYFLWDYNTLCRSDGTASGTVAIRRGMRMRNLTRVGDRLFFAGLDSERDDELWASDGTSSGTRRVKDINPGPAGSQPCNFRDVNGTLYFCANGGQLWKSDGTEAGTVFIDDMKNPTLSNPNLFTAAGPDGDIFFCADDGLHGPELWTIPGIMKLGAAHWNRYR